MKVEEIVNVEQSYRDIGYVTNHNPIDAKVVAEYPNCCNCNSDNTRYVGLSKINSERSSYIAIQVCNTCGFQSEF